MKTIHYEVADQIGLITIKNPPANVLSLKTIQELKELLKDIKEQDEVKAIILKGSGKLFSGGADVKDFASLQNETDYQSLAEDGQRVFDQMEHFEVPIIAAIHGAALGGGLELALACHMRFTTVDAKIGLPELSLGIIPGFAGTQRLPQFVGTAKAYEMILTGNIISGKEALALGLVNQVFQEDELLIKTKEIASKMTEKSKPTINKIMELIPYTKTSQFSEGVEAEAKAFADVFGSIDAREGVSAFIEKRKPTFQDK